MTNQTHTDGKVAIETKAVSCFYGNFRAVKQINLPIERRKITALIGPSGCGKSTVLRAFNCMGAITKTWLPLVTGWLHPRKNATARCHRFCSGRSAPVGSLIHL